METQATMDAARRLRHWLLEGPAQLRGGEHAGGVAGSFDAQGRAGYVYGEITGYWLHWRAGLDGEREARARRAAAAVAWCERQFAQGVPPTRIHLGAADADWRNDATFLFDLAMLAGGIGRAVQHGLVPVPQALCARLGAALAGFVQGGELVPLRRLRGDAPLPDRWSTRLDNYEVKAATRILMLAAVAEVPDAVVQACDALVAERAPRAAQAPVELLHPTLYYLEGVLAARPLHWPGVAPLLARMLALANADGALPEAPEVPGVWRSDVLAQALRVGAFLRDRHVPGAPEAARLDAMARNLAARVGEDGSIPFRTDAPPLANTWCAMFAEQALRWHAAAGAVDPLDLV
jgi:hypothetical protein